MSERERALHRDIMNLQMKPTPITLRLGYREGFMDARRAAAELVASLPPASSPQTCPHCHLPSVVPDVCTPELHAVIEERIAEDWALLNRGIAIGQSFQQPPASSPQTCAWRVDRSGSWTNGCAAEGRPQGFYRSVNHLWSHCHFCGGELLLTPAEEPK